MLCTLEGTVQSIHGITCLKPTFDDVSVKYCKISIIMAEKYIV